MYKGAEQARKNSDNHREADTGPWMIVASRETDKLPELNQVQNFK